MADPTPTPTPAPAPATPATWLELLAKINPRWLGWLLLVVSMLFHALRGGTPIPPPPPPPDEPLVVWSGATGWVNDPEEVQNAIERIEAKQGMPAQFARVAQGIIGAVDDNAAVLNFLAEKKVLGKILPSWDQGPVGDCVCEGWGRGVQDLLLGQIASGSAEQWPGHEVASEPIYGGARVQIGGGRIRGDGAVGAWAGQFVQRDGVVFRQKYGSIDLSVYSVSRAKSYGKRGCPASLIEAGKPHPVQTVAMVVTADELWTALGHAYPVPVCSNVGFEGNAPADGIMEPAGEWDHCMLFRGRFVHPTKGKCVVCQNSWGNYLGRRISVDAVGVGKVELPEGCFAMRLSVAGRMVAQKDSFAISGFKGFPSRKLDWSILTEHGRPRRVPNFDMPFALAP